MNGNANANGLSEAKTGMMQSGSVMVQESKDSPFFQEDIHLRRR